jgi:hypothetical protein
MTKVSNVRLNHDSKRTELIGADISDFFGGGDLNAKMKIEIMESIS